MLRKDSIIALASGEESAPISIIRISGKDSINISNKLFFLNSGKSLISQKSHTVHLGEIKSKGEVLDQVLLTIFKSPNSYTGENTIEISCHGSKYIQKKIIELFIKKGVKPAKPGEFTLRAFINGKMDLSQAEAVSDLISSENQMSHKISLNQMRGGFSSEIQKLRTDLLNFTSLIELELDFSEEDVQFADLDKLNELLIRIKELILNLIKSFSLGNVIKNGIPVAIIGAPNSGKSTLLNSILKEDKAIISKIPGTTRDIIEDTITMQGLSFRFIDTAGIRKTDNEIEKIGIKKTYKKLESVAYIFYLIDSTIYLKNKSSIHKEISLIIKKNPKTPLLVVFNKIDLKNKIKFNSIKITSPYVIISAKNKIGLDKLISYMISNFKNYRENTIITNSRHYSALLNAKKEIENVQKGLKKKISGDLISVDLKHALNYLGEITGEVTNDELLGNIFSKFCIGK